VNSCVPVKWLCPCVWLCSCVIVLLAPRRAVTSLGDAIARRSHAQVLQQLPPAGSAHLLGRPGACLPHPPPEPCECFIREPQKCTVLYRLSIGSVQYWLFFLCGRDFHVHSLLPSCQGHLRTVEVTPLCFPPMRLSPLARCPCTTVRESTVHEIIALVTETVLCCLSLVPISLTRCPCSTWPQHCSRPSLPGPTRGPRCTPCTPPPSGTHRRASGAEDPPLGPFSAPPPPLAPPRHARGSEAQAPSWYTQRRAGESGPRDPGCAGGSPQALRWVPPVSALVHLGEPHLLEAALRVLHLLGLAAAAADRPGESGGTSY